VSEQAFIPFHRPSIGQGEIDAVVTIVGVEGSQANGVTGMAAAESRCGFKPCRLDCSLSAMPVISIVIPCYNAARWLAATLASVLSQRGVDLDVISVDDGSTDETSEVVRSICPDARIIRTENQGPNAARNLGTSFSSGEFVQHLDADDLLAPDKLAIQVAALEQSGADVAYGDWQKLVAQRSGEFLGGKSSGDGWTAIL
jgi:cellulose synthase/poly-beta-1,6-N-acetylglucosamine synthase-like glycosyltransferase